ncbi:MAG: chemotaxis response regulator protein-glutamate methylesterase [Planctomycetota bacterium]
MKRILVTDDSVFMRSAISRALADQADLEVVGKARDGREAVELAKELRPDVVTMDIEMPEMDGLTALRRIMREAPTRVLMCSTLTSEGSTQSLQALRLGAADIIPKEISPDPKTRQEFLADLINRVRALGESQHPARRTGGEAAADLEPAVATPVPIPPLNAADYDLLCIASSTGGPPVLETILPALPADLRFPVVIGQHMPRIFTESMAKRLDEICPLKVVHAKHGQKLEPGVVYVAPGGSHTQIHSSRWSQSRLRIGAEPSDAVYMPSADVLFGSAAEVYGRRNLAVVLTGIGHDGVKGAKPLYDARATILAQSAATCVVYGMPRAVIEAGFATASLSPDQIAQAVGQLTARAAA